MQNPHQGYKSHTQHRVAIEQIIQMHIIIADLQRKVEGIKFKMAFTIFAGCDFGF